MKKSDVPVLLELDRPQMATLVGGDDAPGSSLARDLGYALGIIVGHFAVLLTTSSDSSYVNAKVGSAY